jgi:hypothetical protein
MLWCLLLNEKLQDTKGHYGPGSDSVSKSAVLVRKVQMRRTGRPPFPAWKRLLPFDAGKSRTFRSFGCSIMLRLEDEECAYYVSF